MWGDDDDDDGDSEEEEEEDLWTAWDERLGMRGMGRKDGKKEGIKARGTRRKSRCLTPELHVIASYLSSS